MVSTLEKMAEHALSFAKTSARDVRCKAHDVDNPLRHRRKLLPLELRGEPRAHHHGERAPGR